MARTKKPSKSPHHLKETGPSSVKHSDPYADSTRFLKKNIIAERGFNTDKAPEAFTNTVIALGWTKFIKHRGSFVVPLVREFYQGIPPPKDGIPQTYSTVRGEIIDFSPSAINEFFMLRYSGKAAEKKMNNWRGDEMEEVRKRICVEEATWEKFGSEFKMKKQFLVDEANLWFTFIRHSLMPTAHTTSIDKDRLIVLDAILKGENIDVGKIIAREIEKSRAKLEGNLYFPCLITELCKSADVEIEAKDERRTPIGAIPAVFKPRPRAAAIAPDAIALEQLRKNQLVLCQFVKAQFDWEKAVFEKLSGEIEIEEPPEFPMSLLEEGKSKEPSQAYGRTTQKTDAVESSKRKGKGGGHTMKKQKEVSEESLSVEELETSSEEDEEESRKVMKEVNSSESADESETEESSGSTELAEEENSEEEEAEEEHAEKEVQTDQAPSPTTANPPLIPSPPTIEKTVPETPQPEPLTTQPTNKQQSPSAVEEPQAPSEQIPEPVPIPENIEPEPQQAPAEVTEAITSDVVAPPVQQASPTDQAAKPRPPRLKSWAKRDPRTKKHQLESIEEEDMVASSERGAEVEPKTGQVEEEVVTEKEVGKKEKMTKKRKGEGSAQPRRVSARVRADASKR